MAMTAEHPNLPLRWTIARTSKYRKCDDSLMMRGVKMKMNRKRGRMLRLNIDCTYDSLWTTRLLPDWLVIFFFLPVIVVLIASNFVEVPSLAILYREAEGLIFMVWFLESSLASLDMANPNHHSSLHPPLVSKEARLISIPNKLQLKILSYLSSRDLMAIVTMSKQFLEIIARILAQHGNMWWLPDVLQIDAKSYCAAKLWLWSNQGCDVSFIVGLKLFVPVHVVRAVIKHHPSLRLLDTIHATIIHDNDGDSKYDLQGHNSGLQRLHICPDHVTLMKVLTFIDLCYVKVAPEGPLPSTFLQSTFAASFPPETPFHLALSPPQEFNYQALRNMISPQVALVNQLYLRFVAFNTIKDVLNALSACVPFIKGHSLTLQVYRLEKNALDQILLTVHTSVFPDYELVEVFARNHGNKWLCGIINTRIGMVTYSSVLDSGDSLPGI
ncbi:hypothetical protein ARMGADRAFT_1032474 [Armillaria gallica]|uniref:F-box domain-containing protein n=1 Tax=Armillaria gallica TaxID=47427 RepID=A0A2H3D8L7_ARMGA|nr:hypothetical protein ARMGADRAFT_1032474 [Armillaria gallica]